MKKMSHREVKWEFVVNVLYSVILFLILMEKVQTVGYSQTPDVVSAQTMSFSYRDGRRETSECSLRRVSSVLPCVEEKHKTQLPLVVINPSCFSVFFSPWSHHRSKSNGWAAWLPRTFPNAKAYNYIKAIFKKKQKSYLTSSVCSPFVFINMEPRLPVRQVDQWEMWPEVA